MMPASAPSSRSAKSRRPHALQHPVHVLRHEREHLAGALRGGDRKQALRVGEEHDLLTGPNDRRLVPWHVHDHGLLSRVPVPPAGVARGDTARRAPEEVVSGPGADYPAFPPPRDRLIRTRHAQRILAPLGGTSDDGKVLDIE
jgi:hypothetical protein